MTEDTDDLEQRANTRAGADPAAVSLAMSAAAQNERVAANAEVFLEKQSRLADLQIENLEKQDEFELSHLWWRRFNDQMRGALQIMAVLLGLVIAIALGAAVWNASRADGLVVEALSAPPSFEQRGIGGDVVAADITSKLAAIRRLAIASSYSTSRDVISDHANDIKVEIPETGVSIAEAWRYLRRWLGNERHLTGSLREVGDGGIILAVSLDGAGAITASGKPSDLAAMEQKAAEDVFGAFDPVNHINYLTSRDRHREAMEAAAQFAMIASGLQQADAYGLWSYTTAYATGDIELALARAQTGMRIDPAIAVLHVVAARNYFYLGESEQVLAENRTILSLHNSDQLPAHQTGGFDLMKQTASAQIALLTGDFANALEWSCNHSCTDARRLLTKSMLTARLHDVAEARRLLIAGQAASGNDTSYADRARYFIDAQSNDWASALQDAVRLQQLNSQDQGDLSPKFIEAVASVEFAPLSAVAQAHLGMFDSARATLSRSPVSCVPCETARGDVAVLGKNRDEAAYWYERAARDAPSLPFAFANWGAMLLQNGQYDDAIAKFRLACQRGPRFADPLEQWGEALMLKNRSDLAIAKFEGASKYAPNWERLHLKWGEALGYVGRMDEARAQYRIVSTLDLSVADKAELARDVRR